MATVESLLSSAAASYLPEPGRWPSRPPSEGTTVRSTHTDKDTRKAVNEGSAGGVGVCVCWLEHGSSYITAATQGSNSYTQRHSKTKEQQLGQLSRMSGTEHAARNAITSAMPIRQRNNAIMNAARNATRPHFLRAMPTLSAG